jgi:uncharacterized protein YmfQ (DUF2313 family)
MTTLADQLRLLLPPVSYDSSAPILSAAIEAEASALEASESQTEMVYSAIFADSGVALSEWERLLKLPDPCLIGESLTVRQRVQAVVSKLQSRGGQSRAFFIGLAKALGYNITITTFRPARVGLSKINDPLCGGEWVFTWRVNAPAVTINHAAVGISGAGDPLASWGNKVLECRFSQLQPAEGILLFGYGGN